MDSSKLSKHLTKKVVYKKSKPKGKKKKSAKTK